MFLCTREGIFSAICPLLQLISCIFSAICPLPHAETGIFLTIRPLPHAETGIFLTIRPLPHLLTGILLVIFMFLLANKKTRIISYPGFRETNVFQIPCSQTEFVNEKREVHFIISIVSFS